MKWWKRYCCCFYWAGDGLTDSNTSLVLKQSSRGTFCIPRRHSSFHATDHRPGNQPRRHSSSSSSDQEEEEEGEEHRKRGRSLSTIPSTDSDRAVKGPRSSSFSMSNGREDQRHTLTEIAETPTEEEDPKPDDVYGYLTFYTAYDERLLRLRVSVERADSLPKKSSDEAYNTFVKMSIIFSNRSSLVTRTVKNTLSPIYKEDHIFHTNKSKATSSQKTCLRLSVFDCERQGSHDAVGHALLPLSQLSDGRREKHALPLTPMSIPTKNLGQVLMGLSYVPTQSLLSIQVLKARHITLDPDVHSKRMCNKDTRLETFAKVTLKCAGQKVKSSASRMQPGGGEPFYNFRDTFVLPPQFMSHASLVVSVVVRGMLGRSLTLGRVISGPYTELSDGTSTHWGKMVQEKRNIVQWRNLYL